MQLTLIPSAANSSARTLVSPNKADLLTEYAPKSFTHIHTHTHTHMKIRKHTVVIIKQHSRFTEVYTYVNSSQLTAYNWMTNSTMMIPIDTCMATAKPFKIMPTDIPEELNGTHQNNAHLAVYTSYTSYKIVDNSLLFALLLLVM